MRYCPICNKLLVAVFSFLGFVCSFFCLDLRSQEQTEGKVNESSQSRPESEGEARREAKLLHETLHAMLHMIHIRYFHKDEGLPLPATSFKMVFNEIEKSQKIKVRWLAVNLPAMHLDHAPKDGFEREAVKALSEGSEYFDRTEDNRYRFAGRITIGSECLSCHSPTHTSNEAKIGGLLISMELKAR
jgi:Protein of unknown function (DUF3365)